MSKSRQAKPADNSHVTPRMVAAVDGVIADAKGNRYAVNKVYAAHNAIFKVNAQPETCSSCLRNRVRELKAWREQYTPADAPPDAEALFNQFLADTGVTTESSNADKRAALILFTEQHADIISDAQRAYIDEALENLDIADVKEAARLAELANGQGSTTAPAAPAEGEGDTTGTDQQNADTQAGNAGTQKDPNNEAYDEPAPGVVRHPMGEDAVPVDFTPSEEDGSKGTVAYADGSKVKAGTYTTAAGLTLAVQPGGKATIKDNEDLL